MSSLGYTLVARIETSPELYASGQVIEAVTQCSRRLGITLAFFQMMADEHRSCYRLVVEGRLQLKGRSFPVEIPLEVRLAGGMIEAHGEVEWRLRDLGIEPPSVAGVVKVANGFRMTFDIRARPGGAVIPRP